MPKVAKILNAICYLLTIKLKILIFIRGICNGFYEKKYEVKGKTEKLYADFHLSRVIAGRRKLADIHTGCTVRFGIDMLYTVLFCGYGISSALQ